MPSLPLERDAEIERFIGDTLCEALGVMASKGRAAMVWLPGTTGDLNAANTAKVRHMSEDGGIGGIHANPVPEA
jgi:hypothetical protein